MLVIFSRDEYIEEWQLLVLLELHCEAKIRKLSVDTLEELVDLLHADFKDTKHVIDATQPDFGSIRQEAVQFLFHLGHEEVGEDRSQRTANGDTIDLNMLFIKESEGYLDHCEAEKLPHFVLAKCDDI